LPSSFAAAVVSTMLLPAILRAARRLDRGVRWRCSRRRRRRIRFSRPYWCRRVSPSCYRSAWPRLGSMGRGWVRTSERDVRSWMLCSMDTTRRYRKSVSRYGYATDTRWILSTEYPDSTKYPETTCFVLLKRQTEKYR
jgi:hypothetical protein